MYLRICVPLPNLSPLAIVPSHFRSIVPSFHRSFVPSLHLSFVPSSLSLPLSLSPLPHILLSVRPRRSGRTVTLTSPLVPRPSSLVVQDDFTCCCLLLNKLLMQHFAAVFNPDDVEAGAEAVQRDCGRTRNNTGRFYQYAHSIV